MTDPDLSEIRPIPWTEAEPARLERDQREVAAFDASLRFVTPGVSVGDCVCAHGGWQGVLPVWPFQRPMPDGLAALTGGAGLEFLLRYPAAYPMVPPTIRPLSPEPEIVERTQATWHVLPDGGLCLFQSDGAWLPEAFIVDLFRKAAGWRIEYALMKAQVIEKMSVSGIVCDDSYDHLVAQAVDSFTSDLERTEGD